jgi:hypothetical protein
MAAYSFNTDIDRIAGPAFLDNIKKRHAKYGAMVQGMLIKAQAAQVDLAAEIRALSHAIVTYATKVCAHVDDDNPTSIAEARAALSPIDAHREARPAPAATTAQPIAETPVGT